jgi:hypothetical protein
MPSEKYRMRTTRLKRRGRSAAALAALAAATLLSGCAAPPKSYDYTAFRQSKPRSILVLPPLNDSPDINGTYGLLAQATMPLAESGYYVLPVAVVDEVFKQNGLVQPGEIHAAPAGKLREIFGADAALYITVHEYGTRYQIISSVTQVKAEARLVDLRSGDLLWTGTASASSAEQQNSSGGGVLGILITAIVQQIANTATDASFPIAGVASQRLLSAGRPGGMLFGPHSPRYGQD